MVSILDELKYGGIVDFPQMHWCFGSNRIGGLPRNHWRNCKGYIICAQNQAAIFVCAIPQQY